MSVFRPFEIQAITLMAGESLGEAHLALLRSVEAPADYEYTGSGYFLSVQHPLLPAHTRTLSEPAVAGNVGDIQVGFVVFLSAHALTLECHTWGAVDIPPNFREFEVCVRMLAETPINYRNST